MKMMNAVRYSDGQVFVYDHGTQPRRMPIGTPAESAIVFCTFLKATDNNGATPQWAVQAAQERIDRDAEHRDALEKNKNPRGM